MVDRILLACDLPSRGIYTTVGTYDHSEMTQLLTTLSRETNVPVPAILYNFGVYLFPPLYGAYGHLFSGINNAFDLLTRIDSHIHMEVTKLYPDAELPKFDTSIIDKNTVEMIYQSQRKMADFAEGLIHGVLDYFGESATVIRENLADDGTVVRFLVQKI